ncbi:LysR family transcriptional regulator [soil metagenome]
MTYSNRIPSTKELRAFEAVARLGSIKAAAEVLNVSASALSRRIQSLEEELGQILFVRDIRGINLTDAGRKYAETLRVIFQQLSQATDLVREQKQRTLCVLAPSVIAQMLMKDLSHFEETHPHLQLEIHSFLGAPGSDPLLERANIAYLFGQPPFDGWRSCQLVPGAFSYPACTPGYLPGGMVDDPAELAAYTWISVFHYGDAWDRWFAAQGLPTPKPARVLTVNNGLMAYDAARNGLGIMISGASPNRKDPSIETGDLILAHSFHAFMGNFGYHFAVRPERLADPAVQAFCKWAKMEPK